MPLSVLMFSILEQAKEPLLCLHGAGYFSEEEWIQLDLIMNKKYVWTTGPKSRFHSAMKAGYNANKLARSDTKDSALSTSERGGVRILTSSEDTSSGTSVVPSLDGVGNSAISADFGWELSPVMNSPTPARTTVRKKIGPLGSLQKDEFKVGYTSAQVEDLRAPNSTQAIIKNRPLSPSATRKRIAAWASVARNGLPPIICPRPASISTGTLVDFGDNQTGNSSVISKELIPRSPCKDVNAFETNNAAEWDEEPMSHDKSSNRNIGKVIFEEKAEKAEKILIRENQIVRAIVHSSLPHTPPISPLLEDRKVQKTAFFTRSIRRGNPRIESRDSTYISPFPKTKTCWFWAESVGGCRYRPEECLNLHVKPKAGMLPNYPLKDGKPTWGCLADATPQEVPEGKRPRSCWYWATRGVCKNSIDCKYVHGWVAGGVAPRPKHLVVDSSHEEDSDDSEEEDNDHVDLSGRDIGDKAPSQAVDMTPSFIASRVHASVWSPRAAT